MKRKEVTKFLSDLLITSRLSGAGKYYAREVTLDYGKGEFNSIGKQISKTRRIDFLQFSPVNQLSVDGIEKGEFTCYEVKSCKEDFLSGYGRNFVGEKNYLVMTMSTYKDLNECGEIIKLGNKIGVLVPIPFEKKYSENKIIDEYNEPTPIENCDNWYLETVIPSHKSYRERSIIELLFCMVRSGR